MLTHGGLRDIIFTVSDNHQFIFINTVYGDCLSAKHRRCYTRTGHLNSGFHISHK